MRTTIAALVLIAAAAPAWAAAGEPVVEDLAWLAGSWRSESDGKVSEEHWLSPAGGVMLGLNRTVRTGGRASFEFLRIATIDGTPTYLASPGGGPPTPFRLVALERTRATFENLGHDFPQRIVYDREADRLTATISGTVDGVERSSSWEWRLVPEPLGSQAPSP